MITLNTITKAFKQFETGQRPILISCDDLNDWICKYDRDKKNLFYEVISVEFAKLWEIKVPETALIKVDINHIPSEYGLANHLFDTPCFGSKFIKNSKELDQTLITLFKEKSYLNKLQNKSDLFLIGMFDLWLSNEDRNFNNSNLLIDINDVSCNLIYAIDHGSIFNSGGIIYGEIYQITEDESIINTDFGKIIYNSTSDKKNLIDKTIEKLYLCTNKCKDNFEEILKKIPVEWDINIEEQSDLIKESIFSDRWLKECENSFKTIIQSNLLNEKFKLK